MKLKLKTALLMVLFALLLLMPGLAVTSIASAAVPASTAQNPLASGINNVCGPSKGTEVDADGTYHGCQLYDLFKLIARIANALIVLAGMYAVFRIALAGGQMVASAGNEKAIGAGRKGLSGAIIGLILVLCAFLIVNTLFSWFSVSVGTQNSFQLIPCTLYSNC